MMAIIATSGFVILLLIEIASLWGPKRTTESSPGA